MANVNALTHNRDIKIGDGVYLERKDTKEWTIELHLREWISRLPNIPSPAYHWHKVVKHAARLEQQHIDMTDAQLVAAFQRYGKQMQQHGFKNHWLAHSFAAARVACQRTLGMRHHDVQLAGAWALLNGTIAEMATGEGKTLVATLGASVAASAGVAVHVVTVNDYLSKRDAEENMPYFNFLGLSVGSIEQDMSIPDRQAQYACAITYASNKELVFDYLKDQIAAGDLIGTHVQLRKLYRPQNTMGRAKNSNPQTLLRGLHLAIVDEADSVLIDEARTPLIISETMPDELGETLYQQALTLAKQLHSEGDYELSQDKKIWLLPQGEQHLNELVKNNPQTYTGLWQSPTWRFELVQKALSALHCFHRDEHYIIAEDKIQIVDEFTGRVMPDRSWERGLHQMIEAKEGVEITGQRKTLSQLTYQRFFRRYLHLSGMTGTAKEVEPELKRVYDLSVIKIPTHKKVQRSYYPPRCWLHSADRWKAVAEEVIQLSKKGRAILVGTRSVEASETLSNLLTAKNITHTVLNARQDEDEAALVGQAGQTGHITVATNMAGRGTDIKLSDEVKQNGGLHVILTEFHESARIDRQLFGRSARQGQPGTVQAMVSLEDEAFLRYAPNYTKALGKTIRSTGAKELNKHLLRQLVRTAQNYAERKNRKDRLQTLKQDQKRREQMGFAGVVR